MIFSIFYIFVALSAILIVTDMLGLVSKSKKTLFLLNITLLSIIGIVIAGMLAEGMNAAEFGLVSLNSFSLLFALMFTLGIIFVDILGYEETHYQSLLLFTGTALMGAFVVSFSNSVVSIFVGIEIISIATIFAMIQKKKDTLEAAVKFFVMSAIVIAIFSFGMVLFYGATGTVMLVKDYGMSTLLVSMILLITALAFEATLFPFNLWAPDVYQGAPTFATAMVGGINKKVGFVALIEIMFIAFVAYRGVFSNIFYILAVFTMFYGNLVAIAQKNVKRMMAYSSIAQAGYILIGLAVTTGYGIEGSIVQIFMHMLMFIGVMGVVLFMEKRNRNELNDYIGLYSENKLAAIALTVLLLSLIGMPLTGGFVGKFILFSSAVYNNMIWLAIFGIINSVISIYYYAKIMLNMFARKASARIESMGFAIGFVVVACAVLIIAFGIYPQPIIQAAQSAASYIAP